MGRNSRECWAGLEVVCTPHSNFLFCNRGVETQGRRAMATSSRPEVVTLPPSLPILPLAGKVLLPHSVIRITLASPQRCASPRRPERRTCRWLREASTPPSAASWVGLQRAVALFAWELPDVLHRCGCTLTGSMRRHTHAVAPFTTALYHRPSPPLQLSNSCPATLGDGERRRVVHTQPAMVGDRRVRVDAAPTRGPILVAPRASWVRAVGHGSPGESARTTSLSTQPGSVRGSIYSIYTPWRRPDQNSRAFAAVRLPFFCR